MGIRTVVLVAFLAFIVYLLKDAILLDQSKDFSIPPPWPIFITAVTLSHGFRWLADKLLPPPIVVFNDITAKWRSQVIYACSKLDISEHLADTPKTVEELASLAQVANTKNLLRLLRAAESFGYYKEDLSTRLWSNTIQSIILSSSHKNSLKDFLGTLIEDGWGMWGNLYQSIKEDPPLSQYEIIYGRSMWDTFKVEPEREARFARAMSNADSITWYSYVHDYDWSKYKRVVDIGGSLGAFSAHLLEAYPSIHTLVFDRPTIIDKAMDYWSHNHTSLLHRIEWTNGSFFEVDTLPQFHDGDVVVMKQILHDWTDEEVLSILSNLRQSIGSTKVTLAIVDISLTPHDLIPQKYLLDLHMHVFAKGKERYEKEWKSLLQQSGFKWLSTSITRTTASVITSVPN